ncbi:DNA-nicking endonuclease, Smr domain [Rhodovulum sp. ES.010]|uniref:Smr/MutS family protein n=1 Tax=Rhodovulum sp. ES.010 TaxID=1882821 RepID=UPI0009272D52|nr:Smr/MutS family protein [Rhodovulum sp. ES.010]SIO49505.1 DNA-nicking endonuclease, Smr domain [Rhodovulum sp. ES.010]
MSRRGRKDLSREDRALWEQVARRTRPLDPTRKPPPLAEADARAPDKGQADAPPPVPAFRIGEKAGQAGSTLAGSRAERSVAMDRKLFTRLKRGKMAPEARIDLHGMTLAQAHPALMGFILQSQASGRRLVLVITGKGAGPDGDGPIPERRGVLKRQVPHWLRQAPLAGAVLQVTEAHRQHGGGGAYYVYLRRAR